MIDKSFFITTMPASRPADYYLGCMEGAVFLDFDNCEHDQICLRRISFDGYGCCELGNKSIPLSRDDSKIFRSILRDNVIIDQNNLNEIVRKAIRLNKVNIWTDALNEYDLC